MFAARRVVQFGKNLAPPPHNREGGRCYCMLVEKLSAGLQQIVMVTDSRCRCVARLASVQFQPVTLTFIFHVIHKSFV